MHKQLTSIFNIIYHFNKNLLSGLLYDSEIYSNIEYKTESLYFWYRTLTGKSFNGLLV